MIRFSAALVVVAIGVLIAGVASSTLPLVYLAIGASALALVVLAVGVALKRDELFVGAARPASSGAQERTEQPAGRQETGQQGMPESRAAFGWPDASSWQGAQSGPAHASVMAGPGDPWAFSKGDSPQAPSARPGAWHLPEPGAWPLPEPGFPAAAAAASETQAPSKPSGLRRPAPLTRADPVLPWADALPTRAHIAQGGEAEPAPSWLEDSGDKPAGAAPGAPESVNVHAVADHVGPPTEPEAHAEPEANTAGDGAGTADIAAVADEDAGPTWSTITWDAGDTDASVGEADTSAGEAEAVPSEPAEPGGQLAEAEPSEPAEGKPSSGVEQVTVVPGVPRYHDPDCILIRFMDHEHVQRMTVADAEKAGCTPCRACQPDQAQRDQAQPA